MNSKKAKILRKKAAFRAGIDGRQYIQDAKGTVRCKPGTERAWLKVLKTEAREGRSDLQPLKEN